MRDEITDEVYWTIGDYFVIVMIILSVIGIAYAIIINGW